MSASNTAPRILESVLAAPRSGRLPLMVGIGGPPGAGKTTASREIMGALAASGVPTAILPLDGYHLANAMLVRDGTRSVKGHPSTFDAAGYLAALRRVKEARELVYVPSFEHAAGEPVAASIPIPPDTEIVITEGNYVLLCDQPWNRTARLFDMSFLLDLPWQMCRDRLLARRRALGHTENEAKEWVDRSDAENYRIVMERSRSRGVIQLAC